MLICGKRDQSDILIIYGSPQRLRLTVMEVFSLCQRRQWFTFLWSWPLIWFSENHERSACGEIRGLAMIFWGERGGGGGG